MPYCVYHLHSYDSLLDSCSSFTEYVDRAKAEGMNAIASTEHGLPRSWVEKKLYCDKQGIRFIPGVEIYITMSLTEKVRDNYHTVLLAKNKAGFSELMELIEKSTRPDHFYYTNRITAEEFLTISDNIIKISACLASPLNKLEQSDPMYMRMAQHYDYFEVQHHNVKDQIEYNKRLLALSRRLGIPLIAGTDTHSSSQYKAECREVLMEYKEQYYPGEESMDLVWKTEDELIDAFKKQGALPRAAYMEAIANTQVMADSVEYFDLDKTPKYPILYGSRDNDEAKLHEMTWRMLDEKIAAGIIPKEQEEAFRHNIPEEFEAFHATNMSGFMLSMAEIISWCRSTGKPIGPGRGSVTGSCVAYVTDITDTNPITYHTVFSRFCNSARVELGDIDSDCIDSDRPAIFDHIVNKFGEKYCARVASYNTIASLAFVDDCGGGLGIKWERENHPEKFKANGHMDKNKKFDNANPYHPLKLKRIKAEFKADEEKTKKKYPDLFYYFDGMIGTRVAQSVHPAGMVISCETLDDNWGIFNKDGERCLLLTMDEAHDVNLVKYDMLVLKTVQVIYDCCHLAGLKYPRMHEIDFNDKAVWDDICKSQLGIFQFESQFASDSIKKFKPHSIDEITVVNAALRPSGASYRDQLFARQIHRNPTQQIDAILSDSLGYLVYQEQVISFLKDICGLSASYADTIRRAIGKKDREKIDKAMPEILAGYCQTSEKPKEEAEKECKEYLKVIEDASAYSFNRNHAVAYSLLSYLCGYYRHYYPEQFVAAYTKNAADDDDITTGKAIAKMYGIQISKPKFGQDNRSFFIDSEAHIISDSLLTVKGIGMKDAEALCNLRGRDYPTFVELLRDMTLYPGALDTGVVERLIKLNYFSEFGCIKRLLKLYHEFHSGPHCFKTTHVPATQATRMQALINYELGIPDLLGNVSNDLDGLEDDPCEIIRYEQELYGEPTSVAPNAKGVYIAIEVDTRYSPRLLLYSAATGKKGYMKITKKLFQKCPIKDGDWIAIRGWMPKEAYGRPGVMEQWITAYDLLAVNL